MWPSALARLALWSHLLYIRFTFEQRGSDLFGTLSNGQRPMGVGHPERDGWQAAGRMDLNEWLHSMAGAHRGIPRTAYGRTETTAVATRATAEQPTATVLG